MLAGLVPPDPDASNSVNVPSGDRTNPEPSLYPVIVPSLMLSATVRLAPGTSMTVNLDLASAGRHDPGLAIATPANRPTQILFVVIAISPRHFKGRHT